MYFCNGLRPDDTGKRKGRYNTISYDSHNVTNDFEYNPETRTLHVVDGDYIVFCLSEFGFYDDTQFDCVTCGDFMLLKLLDGEIYIKGKQGVVLGVDAEGTVEAIESAGEGTAIKWYTSREFEDMLANSVRYNYGLPETYKGCEFIRNNLVITVECAVRLYKSKEAVQYCSHLQPMLFEAMPEYDIAKEIEKAKGTKTYFEQMQERFAVAHEKFLAEQAAKAAAGETEEKQDEGGTDKKKKVVKKTKVTTVVKTKSSSKRKKRDDFIDEDSDDYEENTDFNYDDEDDCDYESGDFDGDDEDYDGYDSDAIRDAELEIKMKQVKSREYSDSEDM